MATTLRRLQILLLQDKMAVDEIDEKLLEILSTEISRDGGASLVRDLKDYDCPLESLLKRSSEPKLLAFLEQYPDVFEVERKALPHVVYLLKYDYAKSEEVPLSQLSDAKQMIMDRIIYILKREKGKDTRRNRQSRVKPTWLLNQCKSQLHRYLRLSGKYLDMYSDCKNVHLVGSDEWNGLVSKEFISIAKEYCDYVDGRFLLREEEEGCVVDVETLASILTDKVEEDGGTHISLGLLLHRYPELRKLVGGQDLMRLKEDNQHCFDRITVFTKNNQIYLQSTLSKVGRMEVDDDETALFSVASSKWGKAFASSMTNQCRLMLSKEPENTIAIDLTASVGGITLPLAKTFSRVIAVEIDSHRANLCRRNMIKHGVENVDIRNEDSIKIIPDISNELGHHPRVVAVDPPWGGKHYKSEDKPIMMGKWNMTQVVKTIYCHLSPTVVGIRLPVRFNKEDFFESLKDAGVVIHRKEVKKVGPQLFIILLL